MAELAERVNLASTPQPPICSRSRMPGTHNQPLSWNACFVLCSSWKCNSWKRVKISQAPACRLPHCCWVENELMCTGVSADKPHLGHQDPPATAACEHHEGSSSSPSQPHEACRCSRQSEPLPQRLRCHQADSQRGGLPRFLQRLSSIPATGEHVSIARSMTA